jgi:hypothetical protein
MAIPRIPCQAGCIAIVPSAGTAAATTPAGSAAARHDRFHFELAQCLDALNAKLFHCCKIIMANGAYSFLKVFGFPFFFAKQVLQYILQLV